MYIGIFFAYSESYYIIMRTGDFLGDYFSNSIVLHKHKDTDQQLILDLNTNLNTSEPGPHQNQILRNKRFMIIEKCSTFVPEIIDLKIAFTI